MKTKDTDYLFLSTYLRGMESKMLTRERMERMVEARSNEEAAKVLAECGYEGLDDLTSDSLDRSLADARARIFSSLAELSPNTEIVDVFRIKYDYHNAKAILKCAAVNQDPQRMLLDAGRVAGRDFVDMAARGDYSDLPPALAQAVTAAADTLHATGDPQRADFLLDRAYYGEMTDAAEKSGSAFLQAYVRLLIDGANLKSAVRTSRMEKNATFLKTVLVEGGNVQTEAVYTAVVGNAPLEGLFGEELREAAALGDEAKQGGRLTAFERACDDALTEFLRTAKYVSFGDSVLIAYAAARENEITAARIILAGRLAGVAPDAIRERLRAAYV